MKRLIVTVVTALALIVTLTACTSPQTKVVAVRLTSPPPPVPMPSSVGIISAIFNVAADAPAQRVTDLATIVAALQSVTAGQVRSYNGKTVGVKYATTTGVWCGYEFVGQPGYYCVHN